jgi:phosphate transport system permease protein
VELLNKRNLEEKIFKTLMLVSILIVISSLFFVIFTVVLNGASALSIEMLTQTSSGGFYLGESGGILNAILGSLFLALPATGLAFLMSLGIALYLQREFTDPKIANIIRLFLNILWGIPSIVYGIFCLTIMMFIGFGESLLFGIIALTLLELPIITRSIDDSIMMVPHGLKESSYSLGSTKFETAVKVVRKQAMPGIVAGILLGLGRGIGDAASILFTAGFNNNIPTSLSDSTAALPTMIFHLFNMPDPAVQQKAYAAAFILFIIVFVISLLSRLLLRKAKRYVIK